jgi:ribosomal protein L29
MDKEKLTALFVSSIQAWEQSQQGQKSGYEYERSFDEMSQKLMREIFQASVGELPESRHEKKSSRQNSEK